MCTTSSRQNWESRRRQWKMHKGVVATTPEEDLSNMELWWRKDGEGYLELVDRRLLPCLDYDKWYSIPTKLLY